MKQKLSLDGEAIGHEFEGLSLTAYPDPGSHDGIPWTIGYGHTKGVKKGLTCTQAQAIQWFREDVAASEDVINALRLSLTQGQFDALVLFVLNVGADAFAESTMRKLLMAGDMVGAKAQFKCWNKNGKPPKAMLGLARRRRAEEERFGGASGTVAISIGRSVDKIA